MKLIKALIEGLAITMGLLEIPSGEQQAMGIKLP